MENTYEMINVEGLTMKTTLKSIRKACSQGPPLIWGSYLEDISPKGVNPKIKGGQWEQAFHSLKL